MRIPNEGTHLQGSYLSLGLIYNIYSLLRVKLWWFTSLSVQIQYCTYSQKKTILIIFAECFSHYFLIEAPLKHMICINTWEFRECMKEPVWKCMCECMYVCCIAFFSFPMTGECKNMTPLEWKPSASLVISLCSVRVFTLRLHAWKKKWASLHKSVSCSSPQCLCGFSLMWWPSLIKISDLQSGKQLKCLALMQKLCSLLALFSTLVSFGCL